MRSAGGARPDLGIGQEDSARERAGMVAWAHSRVARSVAKSRHLLAENGHHDHGELAPEFMKILGPDNSSVFIREPWPIPGL
jgi:hypothetical protein